MWAWLSIWCTWYLPEQVGFPWKSLKSSSTNVGATASTKTDCRAFRLGTRLSLEFDHDSVKGVSFKSTHMKNSCAWMLICETVWRLGFDLHSREWAVMMTSLPWATQIQSFHVDPWGGGGSTEWRSVGQWVLNELPWLKRTCRTCDAVRGCRVRRSSDSSRGCLNWLH